MVNKIPVEATEKPCMKSIYPSLGMLVLFIFKNSLESLRTTKQFLDYHERLKLSKLDTPSSL